MDDFGKLLLFLLALYSAYRWPGQHGAWASNCSANPGSP